MNSTPVSFLVAFISTFIMGFVIFATRAFPFILFSHKEPPRVIRFIEKYIPPMIISILVIYCLKDLNWREFNSVIPPICGCMATVILHLWKKNAMLSIFGATALYMILKAFI